MLDKYEQEADLIIHLMDVAISCVSHSNMYKAKASARIRNLAANLRDAETRLNECRTTDATVQNDNEELAKKAWQLMQKFARDLKDFENTGSQHELAQTTRELASFLDKHLKCEQKDDEPVMIDAHGNIKKITCASCEKQKPSGKRFMKMNAEIEELGG